MWSVNKGNLLLSISFGIGSGFRNHEAQLIIKEEGGKGSGLRGGGGGLRWSPGWLKDLLESLGSLLEEGFGVGLGDS